MPTCHHASMPPLNSLPLPHPYPSFFNSMPSSISELSTLLDSAGIKHRQKDDYIRTGFSTDLYEDDDGDFGVNIVLRLEENGELLRIQAPMAYRLPKEASPETQFAVLRTINQLHWESKILQVEMDSEDGEIRLSIDFPIEDGQLTETQLARMVRLFPSLIDQGHLALRDALEKAISLPSEAEISRRFDAFVRSRG